MSLHQTFRSLLTATVAGFVYLQHELTEHVDLEKLESIMQRVMLRHNECTADDRRGFSPVFTFTEVTANGHTYLRLNMHRPMDGEKPGEIYGQIDFCEVCENGSRYPTLTLVANPWSLVKHEHINGISLNALRIQVHLLADYMDQLEYMALKSIVSSYTRIASGHTKELKFNYGIEAKGVGIWVYRNNELFAAHTVHVAKKS